MRKSLVLLITLFLCFLVNNCMYIAENVSDDQVLLINEFMVANEEQSSMADSDGDFLDWIELYNAGNSEINLKFYSIADSDSQINKFILPDKVIQPGEYFLLWGGPSSNDDEINDHIGFGFSTNIFKNEKILLYSNDGNTVVDEVNYLTFIESLSSPYGRVPDGSDNWEELPYPTPLSFNHK